MDVRLAAIAVAIAITFDGDVSAGPFVQGVPQPLNAEIAASRAAVVARAIRPGDETAGWRVERVLHDTTGRVAVGQTIQPDVDEPMHDGVALVISRVDRTVSARPLSAEAQTYLISLPQLNASRDEAVRFATRHLASHDPVISEDVFAMLSQFGAAELLALRETLPADKLRELVNSEETPSHQLGLYGYLLGLCGDPRDATWLRRRLLREEEDSRLVPMALPPVICFSLEKTG